VLVHMPVHQRESPSFPGVQQSLSVTVVSVVGSHWPVYIPVPWLAPRESLEEFDRF
jgi:hypothetical protein